MIRYFLVSITCVLLSAQFMEANIKPSGLTCEYLKNPQVVDITNPRLSWINIDDKDKRGQFQTAWEIRVAGSEELLLAGKPDLWESGKIISNESVNIRYNGKFLPSGQDCWWQVRVWNKRGKVSDWSEPAFWSMGIMDPDEWKAKWIGAPWEGEEPIPDNERPLTASRAKPGQTITDIYSLKAPSPAPMLRKTFSVKKGLISAKAYVTGLGYFEFYLNGKKVGNDVLVPNQTNYGKRPGLMNNPIPIPDNFKEYRVMYLSYDLKDLLTDGENVAGAIVGNGFFNAPINWTESYGTPRFLGQIHLKYSDGTEEDIVSDETWKVAKSPILMDLVFDGEHYDARLEQPGWCEKSFNDSKWENAVIRKAPEGKMKAHMSYPDRVMESLDPVKMEKLADGRYRVDFGQEISGWIHLKNITGEAGRKIDIRYIHKTPSGDNSYTLRGSGLESYSARFTWFVFREVEISNWSGELKPEQISAEAVYTFIETTGKFECSNPLLNDINKIWWRSQTDNMHGGIASDCPNRERSPYTGDGQVACVTVIHNFDARAFYNKWIHDIIGSCNEETGYVPNGAPWQPGCGGGVAWGAAISIMPWEFYLYYGDIDILKDSYEGMKGYIRYMLSWTDEEGIMFSQVAGPNGKPNRWMNLGDWSQPFELPPDNMVHTFYLWRCADITSKVASVLGNITEAEKYAAIAEKTRLAFMKRFYDEEGGTYGKYGGNIFALRMGIPEDQKVRIIAALKADIQSNKGHLDTGIFGTQFFFEVLAENGMNELAYEAMSKRTSPSYGYWIEQGATTSWEGWDNPGSGNHPMFGGGLVWLYRKLAGINIDPQNPGYNHIIFKPQTVNDLSYAKYSNLTPYGNCGISWEKDTTKFTMTVEVPVGATATINVPSESRNSILEGGKKIKKNSGISYDRMENGYAVFNVGSGKYVFENITYR
jgi:alpha-L-rhamnosidase